MTGSVAGKAEPAVGEATAYAPTVLLKSNFWYVWGQIAIRHEAIAAKHRAEARESWPNAGDALTNELQACLVAITAAAFSLEALHADIAPLLGRNPNAAVGRGKAWGYIFDTMRTAAPSLRTAQAHFEWLWGLRAEAVHFEAADHEPEPHPELPTGIAIENVRFSAEAAQRAVDLMLRAIGILLVDPKSPRAVADWRPRNLDAGSHLLKQRTGSVA